MKVFHSIDNLPEIRFPIITVGTFDGLHLGHKKIIESVIRNANLLGGESVIITFNPHPRLVLFPEDNDIKLLTTIDEKSRLFEKMKIDNLIICPFTKEFSRMSSVEFVRDVLVNKLALKKLVIGHDHQFGRNREGSIEKLEQLSQIYEFEVEEILAHEVGGVTVSSTKIREALKNGDVEKANQFLGSFYSITGTVVRGNQIGRSIGFPTANINIVDPHKLIPKDGVYAVKAIINNVEFNGMLNIGVRPTINGFSQIVEVNIFEFNNNIYEQEISIEFIKRIRDEVKFSELNDLKNQLIKDKQKILAILA